MSRHFKGHAKEGVKPVVTEFIPAKQEAGGGSTPTHLGKTVKRPTYDKYTAELIDRLEW
jgi:hypothetical protein